MLKQIRSQVLAEKAEAEVQIAQRDRTIAILKGQMHTVQLGDATEVS